MDVDFELTFSLTWYIHVARVIQFFFFFFFLFCRVVDLFVFFCMHVCT